MSGNDIVDIAVAAAESNWRRKGFLEKIFTSRELEYIQDSPAPGEMVWKLWTMKESAYKIYTRQYGGRFFAPQQLCCTILTDKTGIVECKHEQYQTTSHTARNYIYCIASLKGSAHAELINSCFYLPAMEHNKQQQFIYKKIVARYSAVKGIANEGVAVVKNKNGIPFLICPDKAQVPVSITHHGHFAAFTIN
jgi:phosphopantetheinyl transferase (holo-ACP synthase)